MYTQFSPIVSRFLHAPNHEIEFRIGRSARNGFDTNVGVDAYNKVMASLGQYQGWEKVVHSNETIYYGTHGRRAIYNNTTDEIVRCIKQRVTISDFKMEPFDVRLGISTEIPYEPTEDEEEFEKTKNRVRVSFVRKNLSIDVSMISGSPDDLDAEQMTVYQIEMEIIKPEDVKNENELYNIMYKVNDVMKII
jgi:hypothetical protein